MPMSQIIAVSVNNSTACIYFLDVNRENFLVSISIELPFFVPNSYANVSVKVTGMW